MIEIGNGTNPKVLIVDDEVEVLNSLADLLREDFHVFATSDVDDARKLLVSENMFSIVISGQRMPLLSGVELLAKAAETSPDTARILLTGYADMEAVVEAVNKARIVHCITKPWDPAKLLEMLKPLAEKHHVRQENRRLPAGDVVLHKRAEAALRESEARFRGVFQTSPMGIAVIDAQSWRFMEVNRSFLDIVGYTGEELLARSASDITHPDDWVLEQQEIREALDDASRDFAMEKRYVRKDGCVRWVLVTGDFLMPESGGLIAITNVFDITERKQAEETLKASLLEKEVLLREVHHRVKNNLSSIIGLIDLQRSAIQEPHVVKMLVELSERIRSMSLVHEKLYHSESLSQIDCQDYLDDLIFHLRCSYESRDVHFDVTAEGVEMPLDIAVPCALIINELVTNALKYAFPNKRPRTETGDCRIRVCLTRGDPHNYTLSVADNGVGLPVGLDWTKTKTLGLLLVKMLGQHQLGGTYELNQDEGTRFALNFTVRSGGSHHE